MAALGMPINHAGFFALRDGHPARRLDRSQPFGAVLAHAGHEHCRRSVSPNSSATLRNSTSTEGRCPLTARFIAQHGDVSQRQALHLEVAVARADQSAARQQQIAGLRFLHRSAQISSSRRANISVKPSGICCTTTNACPENPPAIAATSIAAPAARRWKLRWRRSGWAPCVGPGAPCRRRRADSAAA